MNSVTTEQKMQAMKKKRTMSMPNKINNKSASPMKKQQLNKKRPGWNNFDLQEEIGFEA